MSNLEDIEEKLDRMGKDKYQSHLKVARNEIKEKCDGCDLIYPKGILMVTGIESCCGQCYRHLCQRCIGMASMALANGV